MQLPVKFMREVGTVKWFRRTAVRQFYKRVLRCEQKLSLPTGGHLMIPVESQCGTEAYITGCDVDWGSEALAARYLKRRKDPGCLLDVGANIGYYSLYFAPLVSHVYSFEPDPRVLLAIRRNAGFVKNVEVIPCALGAIEGQIQFVITGGSEISHILQPGEKAVTIDIPIETLDSFMARHDRPVSFIKIDAEGHDQMVLDGAAHTIAEKRPLVLSEHDLDDALFNYLNPIGYRVFAYVRHPETRTKWFAELFQNQNKPGETKMLLLVPGENAEEILALATM